jgi:hypothetical protein
MTLDVRARLAQGAAAVADSPRQIHDWYYAEDGLRLDILDADAAALTAASAGAEEALRIHREALDLLSHSWRGGSGSAAGEFLARQSAAAAEIVASLRSAAAALTALRAGLEHLVNAKVDAARSGDFSAVAGSGTEAAAYDVAVSRLGELPAPRFETPARPAELTPQQSPAVPPAPQPVPDQAPAPVPGPVSAPLSAPPGQGWTSGAPVGAPPGLPDIGGSLAGLVTWIAQTLGSYADAPPAGDIADTTDITTSESPVGNVKPFVPEQHSGPTNLPVAKVPAPVAEVPAPVLAAEAPPAEAPPAEAPAPDPLASPPPPAAPPSPPPESAAATDVATPCEIAADELPRVGQ